MSAPRFRPFTAADSAACLALFDGNAPQFFRPCERFEFALFLEQLPCPYFVVEASGRVVACGGYAPDRGRLCWGMVDRARHRQGIGRFLLLCRLRHWYEHAGPAVVTLSTSEHSAPFFARCGFTPVRVIPDGFGEGRHRHDMRLDLDAARAALIQQQLRDGVGVCE